MIPVAGLIRIYPVIASPIKKAKASAICNDIFAIQDMDAIVVDCAMNTDGPRLLRVAARLGHRVQKSNEISFQQAPLCLGRFGGPETTADNLRALGTL